MRTATRIAAPLFVISCYFVGLVVAVWAVERWLPGIGRYLPFGGIDSLGSMASSHMEIVETFAGPALSGHIEALTLGIAIVGALLLMIPISWVYFLTTEDKKIDLSFVQTMIVLPVIVAAIAAIVQNSLALAFSLAGIVAAVRFRFTLAEPAHALYIFVSIAIGLAAGISALGIAFVAALGFVYTSLILWRINYGAMLTTSFFSFLTGRGHDDNDL